MRVWKWRRVMGCAGRCINLESVCTEFPLGLLLLKEMSMLPHFWLIVWRSLYLCIALSEEPSITQYLDHLSRDTRFNIQHVFCAGMRALDRQEWVYTAPQHMATFLEHCIYWVAISIKSIYIRTVYLQWCYTWGSSISGFELGLATGAIKAIQLQTEQYLHLFLFLFL